MKPCRNCGTPVLMDNPRDTPGCDVSFPYIQRECRHRQVINRLDKIIALLEDQ